MQMHGYSDGRTLWGHREGPGQRGLVAAQCPSILPEVSGYHTGGVTWRKPISLPLQHTYLEVVGSNPETAKNFFCTKFNCSHEEMISMLMLTFLSSFQYNLFGVA